MVIERTDSEVIFRRPADVDIKVLQDVTDYYLYKEATENSKATQKDVDSLVNEVKNGLWAKNRKNSWW